MVTRVSVAEVARGMEGEHREWLGAMGVTSVGGFNQLCVSGQVVQLLPHDSGRHRQPLDGLRF